MTSPWSCELHDQPGACGPECLQAAHSMAGPGPYWDLPYDPTGCNYPMPMPEYEPVLDTINHGVMWVNVHPEDCQCDDPYCPPRVAELAFHIEREFRAQSWQVVRPDGQAVTVKRYADGAVVEQEDPDRDGGLILVMSGGGRLLGWSAWNDVIPNRPYERTPA